MLKRRGEGGGGGGWKLEERRTKSLRAFEGLSELVRVSRGKFEGEFTGPWRKKRRWGRRSR